jgi:hypothetical protein
LEFLILKTLRLCGFARALLPMIFHPDVSVSDASGEWDENEMPERPNIHDPSAGPF